MKLPKIKIKKFRLSKRSEKFSMILSISLIPALIGMGFLGVTLFYVSETSKIELNSDYLTTISQNQGLLLNASKESFEQNFLQFAQASVTIERYLEDLWTGNITTSLPSYYINQTIDGKDLDLEFSEKHNMEVDFKRSSYFVYTQPAYGKWTSDVNETIKRSSNLDLVLPSIYSSYPQILWMNMVFNNGVVRGYPYVERNVTGYDPLDYGWYIEEFFRGNASDGLYFSEPEVDELTGRLVIQVAQNVFVGNQSLGILNFAITFDALDSLVVNTARNSPRSSVYLYTSGQKLRSHSRLDVPKFGWNETYLNTSVADLELVSENYSAILNKVIFYNYVNEYMVVNGTTYMASLSSLDHAGLYLAIIREIDTSPVYAEFPLLDLFFIPSLVFLTILGAIAFVQRQWGIFKGKTLDDILKPLEEIMDKADQISDMVAGEGEAPDLQQVISDATEQVSEKVADLVKEKGAELRETMQEKGEELIEKIEQKIETGEGITQDDILDLVEEKIEEKLSLENKIESLISDESEKGSGTSFLDKLAGIGLDVEKLKSGDLSVVNVIDNPATKLLTIASTTDSISVKELASTLGVEQMEINSLLKFMPAETGITLDVDTVKFNKNMVQENLPQILNIAKETFI